ncbi:DUF2846 domain-containing protein [Burkholderia perseverans]|uniref:DUF2846 domain-containing protein n=1 Tax=Burkholderia perseverans TaxID=2615214 RepID=UPI001FEE58A2|nr:DUF2846 domain-containing protein [Burkholderia perseverans]
MRWNWRTGAALTVLATTIALAGCASRPQKPIYRDMWASVPAPAAGQGRIVFFRSQAKLGMASGDHVKVNDQPAGEIPGGGFFYLDEPAGQYTVTTSSAPDRPLTFYLMQGETKYVRMVVPFALVAGPLTPSLESDPAKVREELSMLRYVGGGNGARHVAAKAQ